MSEGDILLLEAILNSEPSPPLQGNYFPETQKDLKICEANHEKFFCYEPLSWNSRIMATSFGNMHFWKGDDKLPHNCKRLENEEKAALIEVLKSLLASQIAWLSRSDNQSSMAVESLHRLQEVERGYPKGPLPTSLHGSNARKTRGKPILLFPRWLFGYFQKSIRPKDQEKTNLYLTHVCVFAYRRMPFASCNCTWHIPTMYDRQSSPRTHDRALSSARECFMDDFSASGLRKNYHAGNFGCQGNVFPKQKKTSFSKNVNPTFGMTPSCSTICADQMIRRCVHGKEALDILEACHNGPTGGHHGAISPPKRTIYIVHVFPYGTVELISELEDKFKVNGHRRFKHYFGGDISCYGIPDLPTFPKDK
ncbi:hypothetical protein Tco_0677594 [Tanacetum coccineum]|uniref:Uncharacterized protein n=1 Tax=Tanacetum coccineum TaxID=301880 RepID=A0ABQ4XCM9_9ASTR